MSLDFASSLVMRYFNAEWSVKIIMSDPTKYARKLSKA